jgi:Family of unknown function (DUF6483)
MINKDYILRIAEQLGRELSILVGLRKRNKQEEELIAIDNFFLKYIGMTSRFINSLSDEMLLQTLAPLGKLNIESALWIGSLLHEEGDIYADYGNETESYYRYCKALFLLLEAFYQEHIPDDTIFLATIQDLSDKLSVYQIPMHLQRKVFRYYEQRGMYARAENLLFETLEQTPDESLFADGNAFYQRLSLKSEIDLQAGDLSHEEVEESQAQLTQLQTQNS